MSSDDERIDAIAKLQAGYRLRVRMLTGGLTFAFLQSPHGSTSKTFVVSKELARQLIQERIVTHVRTTTHGAEIYAYQDTSTTGAATG